MITFGIVAALRLVFSLVLVGVETWAVVNAARYPEAAYNAAFKRTKGFWLAMTAGALVVGILTGLLGVSLGLLTLMIQIAALVVAGVFLADVLPALREVMGRAQGRY